MKRRICFLAVSLFLLAACTEDSNNTDVVPADPTLANVVAEDVSTEPPATATPQPTLADAPQSPEDPALITSAEEVAGIWRGTIAGESGYFLYTPDGHFVVALSQDALASAPRVSGEYWFEDNQIHLRDLENAGHWVECDPDTVGIYDVLDLGDGQMAFQMVEDSCGDSGFTRGYVFANAKQEWIAEPVGLDAPVSAVDG